MLLCSCQNKKQKPLVMDRKLCCFGLPGPVTRNWKLPRRLLRKPGVVATNTAGRRPSVLLKISLLGKSSMLLLIQVMSQQKQKSTIL